MTTVTVNIKSEGDLSFLQELLDRFGLTYSVDTEKDYEFTVAEIASLLKTKQDFLDGKTTARDWTDIEDDLDRAFN